MLSFKDFASSLKSIALVETSESLQAIQREKLQRHSVPLEWHDRIDDLEQGRTFVLVPMGVL